MNSLKKLLIAIAIGGLTLGGLVWVSVINKSPFSAVIAVLMLFVLFVGFVIHIGVSDALRDAKRGEKMEHTVRSMLESLDNDNVDGKVERFVYEHVVKMMRPEPRLFTGCFKNTSDETIARLCVYISELKAKQVADAVNTHCYLIAASTAKELEDLEGVIRHACSNNGIRSSGGGAAGIA